jgi:hypothetical protein
MNKNVTRIVTQTSRVYQLYGKMQLRSVCSAYVNSLHNFSGILASIAPVAELATIPTFQYHYHNEQSLLE